MNITEALAKYRSAPGTANFAKDALGHGSNKRGGSMSWGVGKSPGDAGHPVLETSHGTYRIHPQYYGSKGHDLEYTKKGSNTAEKLGRYSNQKDAKQAAMNHHVTGYVGL